MRYGENPHQSAALYRSARPEAPSLVDAQQFQGKALSYNNIADADAALHSVSQFSQPACVIVKHANPCGAGVGQTLLEAYQKAYETDPTSAFGGIIAFNQSLDAATLQVIIERQFVEVILAPHIDQACLAVAAHKPNMRLLQISPWQGSDAGIELKTISGGLLVQQRDQAFCAIDAARCVSQRAPSAQEQADLHFANRIAKYVKSNAIVYAKQGQTLGIGAGQMSRVYSAKIAALKAAEQGLSLVGCAMASDAFLPFRDGLDQAAAAGVTAIIQPGGSMRDDEVIQAANEHNIAMLFTGMRHFKH